MKKDDSIDIYGIVYKMRQERTQMVQTEVKYETESRNTGLGCRIFICSEILIMITEIIISND